MLMQLFPSTVLFSFFFSYYRARNERENQWYPWWSWRKAQYITYRADELGLEYQRHHCYSVLFAPWVELRMNISQHSVDHFCVSNIFFSFPASPGMKIKFPARERATRHGGFTTKKHLGSVESPDRGMSDRPAVALKRFGRASSILFVNPYFCFVLARQSSRLGIPVLH